MTKDSVFSKKLSLNCGGNLIDLSTAIIMGIINLTPDSFYDGNKNKSIYELLKKAEQHLKEGATILDLGAMSTRPNADEITVEEEKNRLIKPLNEIVKKFPNAIISVDTYRAEIAQLAIENGAHIINDISAGNFDKNMFDTIARLKVPYVLMHNKGKPKSMQENTTYEDLIGEIYFFISEKLEKLKLLGVADVIIDVGFGFGKELEHNYKLLKHLKEFENLGYPILAGTSRKGMIWKVINKTPQAALNGSTVANTIALLNGAKILRVHDTKEAIEAIKIVNFYQKN